MPIETLPEIEQGLRGSSPPGGNCIYRCQHPWSVAAHHRWQEERVLGLLGGWKHQAGQQRHRQLRFQCTLTLCRND